MSQATSKQIERFANTVSHAVQQPSNVFAHNSVQRQAAKLREHKARDQVTEICDRLGYEL